VRSSKDDRSTGFEVLKESDIREMDGIPWEFWHASFEKGLRKFVLRGKR